jgi:glycosyltransferase involved in cell wall biosynthesis
MIFPAKALIAQGHDVHIVPPKNRNNITAKIDQTTGTMVDVTFPEDADVICIQRPTHKYLREMIPIIQSRGTAVVIDIDDDLSCVHPDNPAFAIMHPRQGWDHNWRNAEDACAQAAGVVVSTPALLKRYVPHGRGGVVRNCIPEQYLRINEDKDYQGFGWAGSVQSHPNDLQVVGDAARRLTREGFKYFAVGPSYKVKDALGLDEVPEAIGTLPVEEYPIEVARLKVGIAPLDLTKFNTAKSWLKPLEYASLGTPCVIAPTPEYLELNKRGVGIVAKNQRQWYRGVKDLLTNESLYEEVRAAGRAAVAELTFDRNAWRWLEIWDAAHKFAQKSSQ